ncbi:MAG: hypothetical protein LBS21_13680 [Clostridiales bacterium]|jgi:hypothetical protein|nr:hypothetical protein [Clostridiales bacterium]
MKRRILLVVICFIIVLFSYFIKIIYFPVIYPTKSSSKKLSIVLYGGYYLYKEKQIVTLRHYVDEKQVADYILEIKDGIYTQEPQFYELPELNEGVIEVIFESSKSENLNFTIDFRQTKDFYEKGLLIYFDSDFKSDYAIDRGESSEYDRYIHFVSGKNKAGYINKAGSSEWVVASSSPRLRKIPQDERPYWPEYSGWKENKWIKIQ